MTSDKIKNSVNPDDFFLFDFDSGNSSFDVVSDADYDAADDDPYDLSDLRSSSANHPSSSSGSGSSPGLHDFCNDTNSFVYEDYTQMTFVRNAFVVMYVVIIVCSLIGNFMVIWTIARNRHMRTVTNFYILNLAVADFLVSLVVMPLKLVEYTAPCQWNVFGHSALCPLVYYVLPVFVFTSVLTLAAISIERYYAIVHPLSTMLIHSKTRTRKVITATWVLPLVLASPYLYCNSFTFTIHSRLGHVSRQICSDRFDEIDTVLFGTQGYFRRTFFFFLFFVVYLIPLVLIGGTCVRIAMALNQPLVCKQLSCHAAHIVRQREENKRKVARMIILIAMVFLICWTPFYVIILISQLQSSSFLHKSQFLFTMLSTHWTGFLNSCLNPFIYGAMSNKFRRNFKQMLRYVFCCLCRDWAKTRKRRQYFECQILDRACQFQPYQDFHGFQCAELRINPNSTGLS